MGALVLAREVGYSYPSAPAVSVLDRVNLTLSSGDRLGVVGENGAGKSTLLGVLSGHLAPTRGEVERLAGVAVVGQELVLETDPTVGDLVAASLDAARTHRQLESWDGEHLLSEALSRFGALRGPGRGLREMSVGEAYRVRLACALAEGAPVLLLDEPTNHLDASALRYLTARLRAWPGGVVVVTHDRMLLDDVATAVLDLDATVDGVPARYGARGRRDFRYLDYRRYKDAALERWRTRYRTEQERLAQLFDQRDYAYEHLSDEWRPIRGSRPHRRGTRARQHVKSADRAHERLERNAVEVPPPPPEIELPDLPAFDGGAPVASLAGAVVPGRVSLPGLLLAIEPGGRLLVVGPNGSGKSTLLGLIASNAAPGVRVGYLRQEPAFTGQTAGTAEELATERVLAALAEGSLDPDAVVPLAATGLVDGEDLDRSVAELSVGRRRRLDLALTLMTAPQLLVLDEPTNHLAVDLMDAITGWLREVGCAVVVATHDRMMRADLAGAGWPVLDLG